MNHHSIIHNYQQLSECRAKISRFLAFLSELRQLENNSAGSFEFHRLKEAIEADIYNLIDAMNSEIECGSVPLQSTGLTDQTERINMEESDSYNSSKVDSSATATTNDQSTEFIASVNSDYRRENGRVSFSSSSSSHSEESDSLSESDSDSIESYSDSYSKSDSDSFNESYSSSD